MYCPLTYHLYTNCIVILIPQFPVLCLPLTSLSLISPRILSSLFPWPAGLAPCDICVGSLFIRILPTIWILIFIDFKTSLWTGSLDLRVSAREVRLACKSAQIALFMISFSTFWHVKYTTILIVSNSIFGERVFGSIIILCSFSNIAFLFFILYQFLLFHTKKTFIEKWVSHVHLKLKNRFTGNCNKFAGWRWWYI